MFSGRRRRRRRGRFGYYGHRLLFCRLVTFHIFRRVNGYAVQPYLVVEMGRGALAGIAAQGNDVPPLDGCPGFDGERAIVTVEGTISGEGMLYDDELSIEGVVARKNHDTRCRGDYGCAGWYGDINAVVESDAPFESRLFAEAPCYPPGRYGVALGGD